MARWSTLRRDLVNIPARFAASARTSILHLLIHWPQRTGWKALWHNVISYLPPYRIGQALSTPPSQARPEEPQRKAGTGQRITHAAPQPASGLGTSADGKTKSPSTDSALGLARGIAFRLVMAPEPSPG
ncbi:hypothetical protein MSHI_39740 [Mycobacterium shinjukuense]|uniref:Uncharacterized protein n=1 Tax=Mycobacterium shinjukuense TaxID=398694 RepID=A0A7I7MUV1_9MYCO|nr:hypothetical protein MSHI_39740 [Mycobacterium shinjukuense]